MAAQTFSNCFVCCKKVGVKVDTASYKVRKRICEQFLVLMSRYLNLNRGDDVNHYGSEKTLDIKPGFRKKTNANRRRKRRKLFSCDHCLPLVESVCAIYKDWSVLQIKLNASIKLMANLMQDGSTSMAVTEDFEEAIDFRIRFIKQALNKLNSKDFPHLALKRFLTDSLPDHGKKLCEVVSEQDNVEMTTTAMDSGTFCKVKPEQMQQEQEDEVAVDLDDADWQPNSDVEMDPLENDDDDDDYYNDGDNKQLKVSQKRKKTKKVTESTDDADKPFKCQICGKGFAQQTYRERHEKRHTQPFKCRLCDRRFSLRIDLRAHEKIHKEGKANQFQCGVCSRFFLKKADCTYHIRRVHEGKGDVLKDGIKWQPEPRSDNTKKNEQRKRTLKCQFCPRSFSRHLDKVKHEKIHRKKSFKCPHCEMTFKRRCVLNTHLNRHSKPYQCGLCGTRFTQRNNCRNHQSRVHKVIDGVILKITEKPNEKDASRPPIKIETNLDGEGDPNTVSAEKRPESLGPTTKTDIQVSPIPDDNDINADNANADSDSGSADIWQPGSGDEADDDDDANNGGDSPGKDEKSNPVQAEEEEDDDGSKKQPRKFSNAEIARLRSKDPLPFKCEECEKYFALPSLVTAHVRLSHRKEIQRQCDTCGKEFSQLSSFKRHVDRQPNSCNRIINRLQAKDVTPNPESIVLEILPEVARRRRMTKREMAEIRAQTVGDPLPFKCTECDQAYAVNALLQRHRRSAHKIGVLFRCSICSHTFSEMYRFKRHMNIHTNSRPFKCRFCSEKSYNCDTSRAVHERRCNANPLKDQIDFKKHKCGICGQGFEWRGPLQDHVRAKHGLSEVPPPPPPPLEPKESSSESQEWICEKCGEVFPNQRVLYTHMLRELGKDFSCSVCGKGFRTLGSLQQHEKVHRERFAVGQ